MRNFVEKIWNVIFWGGLINFLNESYLIFMVCILLNLNDLGFLTWTDWLCSLTTIFLAIIVVPFPFVIIGLYVKRWHPEVEDFD